MSYIKSRKHAVGALRSHPKLAVTAALAAGLAMNLPVHAQNAPTKPAALPEITVSGQAEGSDYKADTLSSPKFTEPLVDTPRTVQVIKESLFKEQAATTLAEVLRNSPGVGTFFLGENGNTTTGDAVFMRGFDASSSIFIDGIRDTSTASRDIFNTEAVEVIKGPSGSDYGRSSPTGSINLVSKQPKLEDSTAGSVSLGTSNQKRASLDVNRRFENWDGAAFRLNMFSQDSDVPGRDHVNNSRWGIAPSLAFGLNSDTRVFLNYLHSQQNNVPDGGVPTIGLPGYSAPGTTADVAPLNTAARVNSKNFYGTSQDFDKAVTDMASVKVEHDLSNGMVLSNTTRYARTSHDYMLTSFMGTAANISGLAGDPSTWTIARSNPTNVNQINTIVANQTNLRGQSTLFGLKHSWNGGLELSSEEQVNFQFLGRSTTGTINTAPAANLYNPDWNAPGFTRTQIDGRSTGVTKTVAAYAFDTVKLTDRWSVNAGLRFDRYKTNYESNPNAATATAQYTVLSKSGNLFGWNLGTVYKPAENGSIYAAYGVSQQPPGGATFALSASGNNAANPKFDPQKAKTAELGTKWDLMDRQLGVAATLYRTEVTNDVVADATDPTGFSAVGKKRVQGVELTAIGQITKAWAVSSGYTTMHTQVVQGPVVGADATSNALNYTPKSAFTVWTTYRTPFGLTFGGGARYNGKLQRGQDGAPGTPKYSDSYVVFDAVATYTLTKNVNLQLNIYNIFDKDYVAAINKSGYRYTPGVARYALLSANFRF